MRLRGRLEVAALAGSLDAAVRRHEVLRTVFRQVGDRQVQAVAPVLEIGLATDRPGGAGGAEPRWRPGGYPAR